ncbi:MAG: hypothetical protein WC295_04730 [Methanoregula sp.]|jgi:HSP20 family molecular chaperone IbpA
MVRRFHRSIYDELDELKASMDYLFQFAFQPMDNPLLPNGKNPDILCQYLHTLHAEVTEANDEVIVTVDTILGGKKTQISVDLVTSTAMKITGDQPHGHPADACDPAKGNERSFSLHHAITLPSPVTITGARSTLKNSVLDIHLKKILP